MTKGVSKSIYENMECNSISSRCSDRRILNTIYINKKSKIVLWTGKRKKKKRNNQVNKLSDEF